MTYTFTHTDFNDVEVSMCVPERGIDEMCEYFQRFLSACGYVFDEGENIRPVKDKADYPGCGGDILTFNDNGSPFVYDFGDGNNMNCFGGTKLYGAAGNDTICL